MMTCCRILLAVVLTVVLVAGTVAVAPASDRVDMVSGEELTNGRQLTQDVFLRALAYVFRVSYSDPSYQMVAMLANKLEVDGRPWRVENEDIWFPQFDPQRHMQLYQARMKAGVTAPAEGLPPLYDPNAEIALVASRLGAVRLAVAYLRMGVEKTEAAREVSDEAVELAREFVVAAVRRTKAAEAARSLFDVTGLSSARYEDIVSGGTVSLTEVQRLARAEEELARVDMPSGERTILLEVARELRHLTSDSVAKRRACLEKLEIKDGWATQSASATLSGVTTVVQPILDAILSAPFDALKQLQIDPVTREVMAQRAHLHRVAVQEAGLVRDELANLRAGLEGLSDGSYRLTTADAETARIVTADEVADQLGVTIRHEAMRNALLLLPGRELGEILERAKIKTSLKNLQKALEETGEWNRKGKLVVADLGDQQMLRSFVSDYLGDDDLKDVVGRLSADDIQAMLDAGATFGDDVKIEVHHYGLHFAKSLLMQFEA